jgi:hypothetical protein
MQVECQICGEVETADVTQADAERWVCLAHYDDFEREYNDDPAN